MQASADRPASPAPILQKVAYKPTQQETCQHFEKKQTTNQPGTNAKEEKATEEAGDVKRKGCRRKPRERLGPVAPQLAEVRRGKKRELKADTSKEEIK